MTDLNLAEVQVFGECNDRFMSAGLYRVGQYDNEAFRAFGVESGGTPPSASTIIIPEGLTIKAWKGK